MRTRSFSVRPGICDQRGFTYVELLITITISALLVGGLMGVVNTATRTSDAVGKRNDLSQQARFAMQQMVHAVSGSSMLLLPMADKKLTPFVENIREQTWPASAPPTGSLLGTAVLAVTLPVSTDLDADGVPDADNDADGAIDEDLPEDTNNDGKPGLSGIDDDGNGIKDSSFSKVGDDDESADLADGEDPLNGADDDGDGVIDEDPKADNNGDACPGVCGVDDDGDGGVDEGGVNDDDEDGKTDEDWYDPLVFHMVDDVLWQRMPVPWDENADGAVNGQDFVESVIAEHVTRFRVERVASPGRAQLVDITLELTDPVSGESVSLQTTVRVGGGL